MVKLLAWFRRRGFAADVRHLRTRMSTPEDRLVVLKHLIGHLKKCTFRNQPIAQVDLTVVNATPIQGHAATCDTLLLTLNEAAVVVDEDQSYNSLTYTRLPLSRVLPEAYLVDNNRGLRIPTATVAQKFLVFAPMLLAALEEQVSEEKPNSAHHLRRTSELVSETIQLAYYLLAVSDQRLTPPSAA